MIAHFCLEPKKLVRWQEDIRNIRHLSIDFFGLHRFGHLHCWDPGNREGFWCLVDRSYPWTNPVCARIWTGTYDMGEYTMSLGKSEHILTLPVTDV